MLVVVKAELAYGMGLEVTVLVPAGRTVGHLGHRAAKEIYFWGAVTGLFFGFTMISVLRVFYYLFYFLPL